MFFLKRKKIQNKEEKGKEKKEEKKEEKKIEKKEEKKEEKPFVFSSAAFLIKKPSISEKATALSEQNKYVFAVEKRANKKLVKQGIESIYKVKVSKVSILNQKGKRKRIRGIMGKRPDFKKAIVTLKKGHSIEVVPK